VLEYKWARGESTEILGVNVLPSRTIWIFSVLLLCLLLAVRFVSRLRDAIKDREKGRPSAGVKGVSA
jgi:hypothetical protein